MSIFGLNALSPWSLLELVGGLILLIVGAVRRRPALPILGPLLVDVLGGLGQTMLKRWRSNAACLANQLPL